MFTLDKIAEYIGASIEGNKDYQVEAIAKIENATAQHISFLTNEKYIDYVNKNEIGILLVSDAIYQTIKSKNIATNQIKGGFLILNDAYAALPKVLELFATQSNENQEYKIGTNSTIYPNVFIGTNVQIGNDCIIYPNVSIYADCIIGNRVIIHSGAVIGADGFGFAPQKDGTYNKIPQLGNVIIEDDCEIGANTCIDRATIGSTIIRKGVKLDNLIQVGHNVEIGEHTVIAAQTGIAGSTKIGHHNMIGGQVGFVGHISIAPYTKINAQSGVAQSVKTENEIIGGAPAFSLKQFFKSSIVFKQLPELQKQITTLQNEIQKLKEEK
ncbi:MAG TPA: UDP-3-O-(3-hydroxymyristoyl)glucosamine N-acyltransferase [Chitinophagales bacterium]|nr:UDP-3-O-(3-hydroxymyristoyl)glucosamine N-acyltransferase [Chitinophagales bacterium]MCB9075160.1 UDP-3-O-(3-hydroxymyristoyl)glucosamine N-acyltransferase [Chitinophagales bacterium]HMU98916.1 UDP-3-O-(3-hydroxymyristoyl)glucosamine N-acyltransferase [Chitinophagales bacterium]HMV03453.1 UDP-3-O-(3-hydroxymyristoyl)glucosamine N-acyltransferase [Chitinophagales bacterium]HMW93582.1 UDP-3-O-(3-hydroxymyristoyl)glucosamine N-acyltransferase [Chitinophagales bacterium]